MKKSIIFILGIVLGACDKKQTPITNTIPAKSSPIENLNIQTDNFQEIKKSGILLFPLKMGENKGESNSYSYKEIPNYKSWNILFYNTHTKEQYLLTKNKVLISDYFINTDKHKEASANTDSEIQPKSKFIFYVAKSLDFNQNKHLDDNDPNYLYISNLEGKNFRLISPPQLNVESWEYIYNSNKVILTARKDSNGNTKFDEKDEIIAFEIDLNRDGKPIEIFSSELQKEIKTLFDKDWKRIR